jgi:hypothetical protein
MKEEKQNLRMKDEDAQHRDSSASGKLGNSKIINRKPDEEKLNEHKKRNYDFDERDQKQNVGQKGDTYPPDDKRPEEDLSNEDDLNMIDEDFLTDDINEDQSDD